MAAEELIDHTVQTAKINDLPKAGQAVSHNGRDYTTTKEGLAYILIPPGAPTSTDPKSGRDGQDSSQSVFYNPIQQFNRDLSVLAIRAFGEDSTALRRQKWEQKARSFVKKGLRGGRKRKRGDTDGPVDTVAFENLTPALQDETPQETDATAVEAEHATESSTSKRTDGLENLTDGTSQKLGPPQTPGISSTREEPVSAPSEGPTQPVTYSMSTNGAAKNKSFMPSFTILDALSATGLRALRYAQEIPFASSITANDLLPAATASIKLNVKHNRLEDKIFPITGNALAHMYSLVGVHTPSLPGHDQSSGKYDVIDLDPYGTAAPFLDAAVQALNDGGLLCVTCTDAGVFASTGYLEKTYALYGGLPLKGPHCHEAGLRLILHAIATSAARYGLAIEPLLSLSIDFYARVFVRIRRSAAEVKFLAGKTMMVNNCDEGCGAWTTQPLARNKEARDKKGGLFYKHQLAQAPSASSYCEHCGTKTHLAGPMYAGPLHSPAFVHRILDYLPELDKETYATTSRIEGMLSTALEESLAVPSSVDEEGSEGTPPLLTRVAPVEIDSNPFFFVPNVLAKVLHCQTPSEDALRGALRHQGYTVTRSHTKPGSIRTDAPWSVIWDIMKEWVRQKAPVKQGALKESTAGWRIMQKASVLQEERGGGVDVQSDAEDARDPSSVQGVAKSSPVSGGYINGNATIKSKKSTIIFDEQLGKETDEKKLVRYQLNPRANWGPMNRATGGQT